MYSKVKMVPAADIGSVIDSSPCKLLEMEDLLRYLFIGYIVWWSIAIASASAIVYVGYLLFPIVITFVRRNYLRCRYFSYFICEFIRWEIVTCWENWQRSTPTPFENPWPSWEVVADLQACSNEELFRVTLCDVEPPMDDSLHPHVSLIYAIGVQDRNRFWRDITIWQISTLTGKRRRVHTFHTFLTTSPHIEQSSFYLSAHKSRGVIFVHVNDKKIQDDGDNENDRQWALLFVYDTRFKKSAPVVLPPSFWPYYLGLATVCLGRRSKPDRPVSGWRIRILAFGEFYHLNQFKSSLVNVVMDVCAYTSNIWVISEEDLLFRHVWYSTPIRAGGTFGVRQRHGDDGRIFAYNTSMSRFEAYDDIGSFKASHTQWNSHWSRVPVSRYPAVMTEWEDIMKVDWTQLFFRTSLRPPALKLLASRTLLKKIPELESMSVVEFQRKTGVDLVGHLRTEGWSGHSMLSYL